MKVQGLHLKQGKKRSETILYHNTKTILNCNNPTVNASFILNSVSCWNLIGSGTTIPTDTTVLINKACIPTIKSSRPLQSYCHVDLIPMRNHNVVYNKRNKQATEVKQNHNRQPQMP